MPVSFAEALHRLEERKQERAIWHWVVDHLNKFVNTEVRDASHGIPTSGCVAKSVPQDLIAAIVEEIEGERIAPLDEEIRTLENLRVVEARNEEKPKKNKRAKVPAAKKQEGARVVVASSKEAGGNSS